MYNEIAKASSYYCSIRLIVTGTITIIIGIIMVAIGGYMLTSESLDTSKYIEITAVNKSGRFDSTSDNKYNVTMYANYSIDGKTNHTGTVVYNNNFSSIQQAEQFIEYKKEKTETLYYDPKDHSKSVQTRSAEDLWGGVLVAIAIVLVLLGVVSIVLRNNPIFCGYTIVSDAMNAIRH